MATTDWTWDAPHLPDPAGEGTPLFYPDNSRRASQTLYRRGSLPPKHRNTACADDRLAARVGELWGRNVPQGGMLGGLAGDWLEVKEGELGRLRARNGWLPCDPRGHRPEEAEDEEEEGPGGDVAATTGVAESSPDPTTPRTEEEPPAKSSIQGGGAARRRRRRTRGWAGQPADPPGPPRFPSETTIDEARLILRLDSEGYRAVRAAFQRICEERGVVKKTLAGPERWDAAKEQLARDVPQLRAPAGSEEEEGDGAAAVGERTGARRRLALDIICTDVTKRMRDGDRRMTPRDAKKALGISAEEVRALRSAFYEVLAGQEVPVRCKPTAGPERWARLVGQWTQGSELARGLLAGGQGSAGHGERRRALDVLATDVMKRVRDGRMRRESRVRAKGGGGPGTETGGLACGSRAGGGGGDNEGSELSEASRGSLQTSPVTDRSLDDANEGMGAVMGDYNHVPPMGPMQLVAADSAMGVPAPVTALQSHDSHTHAHLGLLLDAPSPLTLSPSRLGTQLLPGDGPAYVDQPYGSFIPDPLPYSPPHDHHHHHRHHNLQPPPPSPPSATPTVVAVYLRLHPSSTYVPAAGPLWIATLGSRSLRELRHAAAARFGGDAVCVGVEGVVGEGEGGGCALGIKGDEELGAYLAHLEGGTPTFNVTMAWRGGGMVGT